MIQSTRQQRKTRIRAKEGLEHMCTYNTKRAFRAISHSLLKSILASKAPDMRIPWNRVTQRKIEPLYAEFLKLDDGLRAEIDSVLYEICSVADCPANATTLHVQIQQHGLVPPEDFAEWSIHDKADADSRCRQDDDKIHDKCYNGKSHAS